MVQCSFTPCYVSNYFISDQFIMSNKNYKLFCLCSGLKVEPDLVLHRSFGFCPNEGGGGGRAQIFCPLFTNSIDWVNWSKDKIVYNFYYSL